MSINLESFTSAQELFRIPLEIIPSIILAVIIFFIGWFIGWILERACKSIFKALPFFDEALKNVGLEEVTKRAGIRVNLGVFFGVTLKIFVIFVFLVASLDVLGLQSVNEFFVNEVIQYIPNVISAGLVMVIGLVVANFLSKLVAGTSRAVSVEGVIASKVTKWAIIILSILVALGELGIASELIQAFIVGIIAATSLALGLAFGLGGQQAASDLVSRFKDDINKN